MEINNCLNRKGLFFLIYAMVLLLYIIEDQWVNKSHIHYIFCNNM